MLENKPENNTEEHFPDDYATSMIRKQPLYFAKMVPNKAAGVKVELVRQGGPLVDMSKMVIGRRSVVITIVSETSGLASMVTVSGEMAEAIGSKLCEAAKTIEKEELEEGK